MENTRFNLSLYAVGEKIRSPLLKIDKAVAENIEEIRLRQNLPVTLTISGKTAFVKTDGNICFFSKDGLLTAFKQDLEECFRLLCSNSVYAHTNEIENGFVTMKNGCRAGVFGNLNEKGHLKDITSINIRIAREVVGSANPLLDKYSGGGLLIAGPPSSGKTTVLRDLIRQLAGKAYMKKISVIDSRAEISGGKDGILKNDLGILSDVLITPFKAKGIEIALRTMNPDIIAFDEIGTKEELSGVLDSLNSGVEIITTAHAGSIEEIKNRNITASLLKTGAIKTVAVLPKKRGADIKVLELKKGEKKLAF